MKRFFIIGNPRSGTTLLRLMLNKHCELSVPPEAGFLVWLYESFKNYDFDNGYQEFIASLQNTTKIEAWNINFDDLNEYMQCIKPSTYSEVIDSVYNYYSDRVLNKNVDIYGDKNNFHLEYIEFLQNLYKEAKFIHIIRDGRSVAASYQGLMKKNISSQYAPNLPSNIVDTANEWKENITKIETSFLSLSKKNFITIRFEDLVTSPVEELTKITDFLNIKYDDGMLNFHKTSESEGLEPKEYLGWKSKNLSPLDSFEADKYKLLTSEDDKLFNELCDDLMVKYGYI